MTRDHLLLAPLSAFAGSAVHRMIAAKGPSRAAASSPRNADDVTSLVQCARDAETVALGRFQTGVNPLDLLGDQPSTAPVYLKSGFHAFQPSACFTRSGVIGVCRRRTPASSANALAMAGATAASPSGRHRSGGCWSEPPR